MLHILQSAHEQPAPSSARATIVSFVIGEIYARTWSRMCSHSWIRYAERTGVDIIILQHRIDASDVDRSPAWQKLLILDQPWSQRYERIIWLDSDIIINQAAPDILEYGGPIEKVGLCEDSGRLSAAEAQIYLERKTNTVFSPRDVFTTWRHATRERYILCKTSPHEVLFNTGVMVLSPEHHNDLLKSVYTCPEMTRLFEQPELSHRLLEQDLAHVLSPRYNWGLIEPIELIFNCGMIGEETPEFMAQVMHVIVRSQLNCAYFLHFYGAMNLLTHYADNAGPDAPQIAIAAE